MGSPCVHNPQLLMQCNARMSHGGRSLCAQPSGVMQCNDELLWEVFVYSTLSCAQQFLTRIFYVWKIAVTPQSKGGAL